MAALLCESFGKLCSSCCSCLWEPLELCCHGMGRVVCSPFFPYVATTLALNVPPALFGLQYLLLPDCLANNDNGYGTTTKSWLPLNAVLATVHVIGAFYIVHQIQKQQDLYDQEHNNVVPAQATVVGVADAETGVKNATPAAASHNSYQLLGSGAAAAVAQRAFPALSVVHKTHQAAQSAWQADRSDQGAANSFQRMSRVLCYDAGVALYILLSVCWIAWQSVGMSQLIMVDDNNGGNCPVHQWMVVSLVCGFLYAMLVCIVFSCSMLCLR